MRTIVRNLILFGIVVMVPLITEGQATVNLQGVSLVQASFASLVGGDPLQDLRLTGTAFWATAPSARSGPVRLEILGSNLSRAEIGVASIAEVRDSSSETPSGNWKGADGAVREMATHNCRTPAGWFLPYGFVTAAIGSDASVFYVGREVHNGVSVDHLRYYRNLPAKWVAVAALLKHLTTVDLFLDPTSHLPLFVDSTLHPDSDVNVDLPVEVRFSDYRQVNGVRVPFRIQRFLQGDLQFDATINRAELNSGLLASDFTLQ